MTPEEERQYIQGQKSTLISLLRYCLIELGVEGFDRERLILERAETIQALRSICADYGDNEWEDSLHLVDIIEKHLVRHLGEPK